MKHSLRATIRTVLIATPATGLAGMPWVDLDHADTACLRFVLDKGVQLGKAPTMQPSLVVALLTVLLAASHLGGLTNVLEVLQDEGTARGGMLNNLFGEDVVMIFVPLKLFPAQLFKVAFCRASALKGTPFLPSPKGRRVSR